MEFPFSPLITSPPELVTEDYDLSYDNIMIHLQSLLDSSKKHITKADKDYLQGFVNYRKRLNENITSRINPLPPKKSDILYSKSEERPSTWGNYLRYYHESLILEPKIIINPLFNKKMFIKEYPKHGPQSSTDYIMKYKLDDTNVIFTNDMDHEEEENNNNIRKIMINAMVYEYEPKTIHPPSTYIKDRFSVEMNPVSLSISPNDYQIYQFYKFLNETDSLLEHAHLHIGKAERFVPRKLPVKIAKIRNLINTAFQKGVLFYYPRINYINMTRKRLLRIKTSSITEIEEEQLSNVLKQFPLSVHVLGEIENYYFIKLSDHQDAILYDRMIEFFPSLEKSLGIFEYSYPDPDLVLSVLG